MDKTDEDAVRERAHQLWKQAGQPDGQDEHFWHEAEQQLRDERVQHELKTPDTL